MTATQSARIRYVDDPAQPTPSLLFDHTRVDPRSVTLFARSGVEIKEIRISTPSPRELTAAEEDVLHSSLLMSVRLVSKGRLKR